MAESTCWSGQPDCVERLEAENAKLRAALTEVRDISIKWGNSIPWKEGERIAAICEATLKD